MPVTPTPTATEFASLEQAQAIVNRAWVAFHLATGQQLHLSPIENRFRSIKSYLAMQVHDLYNASLPEVE